MDDSRTQLAAFESFDLPVVRFDQQGVLTYANRAAQRLLGCATLQGIDLSLLFPEHDNYQRALSALQGGAGASEPLRIELRLPWREHELDPVPVNIYAMPSYDPRGQAGSMIALLKDLREEEARQAMHGAIATSLDNDALFKTIAELVKAIVPFDEFHVTIISQNRERMRELYAMHPQRELRELRRWWTLPPFVRDELPGRVAEIVDVDNMRTDPQFAELARTDKDTAAFFETRVCQFISLPVRHDNRVVAFVALYSHRPHRYVQEDLERLVRLPLAEAILAALHRERDSRLGGMVKLIDRIGRHSRDLRKVADELVTGLREQFDWEHVSIFQHDEDGDSLRLLCQANDGKRHLSQDRLITAGMDAGPLTEVMHTLRPVNHPYDRAAGPFTDEQAAPERGSQFALPVSGGRTHWILYVESHVMNAFAEEEIEALEMLANRAAAILAHSTLFETQNAVLQSISDAVIETSNEGRIRWCNAAAKTMLGVEWGPGSGHMIHELASDDASLEALRDAGKFSQREVNLRCPGETSLPVLLSAAPLPDHLGGRVYVASDYSWQREVQRLDVLKNVFRQAAMEGRVPLALASSWLADWSPDRADWRNDVEKVLRQLARADLPLERLLRLSSPVAPSPARPSDLSEALENTLEELPAPLAAGIEARTSGALAVMGDYNDIQFCVESMISFGVRTRPESKKLRVSAEPLDGQAVLRVEGDWALDGEGKTEHSPDERWRRKTLYDLTLGDSVIAAIVEQAGGHYARELSPHLSLRIALPLTRPAGARLS